MRRAGSFKEFWPSYVDAHRSPVNRALHVIGTTLAICALIAAVVKESWLYALAAPVLAYGCAWVGHFLFEHNRPATFTSPFYSLLGDLRMYGLTLTGRMAAETRRIAAERDQR
jgi:hypothetical protein